MACSGMDCSVHCSLREVALDAVTSGHEGMQQVDTVDHSCNVPLVTQ
jgi:hypothetical protein